LESNEWTDPVPCGSAGPKAAVTLGENIGGILLEKGLSSPENISVQWKFQ